MLCAYMCGARLCTWLRWELVVPPYPKKTRPFGDSTLIPRALSVGCFLRGMAMMLVYGLSAYVQLTTRRERNELGCEYIAVARGQMNEYWEMLRLVVGRGVVGRVIAKPEIVPWCNVIILCFVYLHSWTPRHGNGKKEKFSFLLFWNNKIIKNEQRLGEYECNQVDLGTSSHHRQLWLCVCEGEKMEIV